MEKTGGEEQKITSAITGGFCLVLFAGLLVVGAYCYHFDTNLSGDPAAWGAFGDYIGGLRNPLVAFVAFVLLAKSLQIQHKELRETSEALKQASEAQGEQVAVQKSAAMMNSYAALISSLDQDIAINREEFARISKALSSGDPVWIDGRNLVGSDLSPFTEHLANEMNSLDRKRDIYKAILVQIGRQFEDGNDESPPWPDDTDAGQA